MTDSGTATRGRGIGITIKYGKGYEETWATFQGTPAEVRDDIVDFFGLDAASVADLTVSDIVVNATGIAHAKGNTVAGLGGKVISRNSTPAATPAADEAQQSTGDDPWANADQPADEPKVEPTILEQIAEQQTVKDLQLLWSSNQEAFKDAEVMAAWKARGKALQTA